MGTFESPAKALGMQTQEAPMPDGMEALAVHPLLPHLVSLGLHTVDTRAQTPSWSDHPA